jgi:hypothetical protein
MRASLVRRIGLVIVVSTLLAPLPARSASTPHAIVASAARRGISPQIVDAALRAPGTLVRRGAGYSVERVSVPAGLRPNAAAPKTVFRVTLAGTFSPRALRYEVLASGRPIGFGVPTANGRAVRAITTDAAVLDEDLSVRYEGQRSSTSAARGTVQGITGGDTIPDPAVWGPDDVTRAVYDLGNRAFQPSDLQGKVELTADVHYPTGLPDGPYPLVLFLHGNHSSCYLRDRADYRWPCKSGWKPLPNYAGYDYIAKKLASYGYIVVSVSANGVNVLGNSVEDTGMRQRGELLEKHIDLWNAWNTTGGDPFGTTFVGKVDMDLIGTMGHSRGGEGAVWNTIVDDERPSPYGIDAVLALAPVDFTRQTIADVPFSVMLPYCDGDVSDLEGVHFFDDSRYVVPGDPTAKSTVSLFGANHNFFNRVWSPSGGYPGSFDDGRYSGCSGRLTARQERHVGAAFIVGFFRRYLGDETAIDPMWTGAAAPQGVAPTLVSYLAPDAPDQRLDIDRLTDPSGLSVGDTSGAVTATDTGVLGWCDDRFETACIAGFNAFYDAHLSFDFFFSGTDLPGLQQGVIGWSDHDATVRFDIPPGDGDVSGFDAFQFRAATNPGYFANDQGGYQDLEVALIDGNGDEATVLASDVGNEALFYPIGRRGSGHFVLSQIRFPLDRFGGVDLTDIQAVELRFTRTLSGVIDIADVNFTAGAS